MEYLGKANIIDSPFLQELMDHNLKATPIFPPIFWNFQKIVVYLQRIFNI